MKRFKRGLPRGVALRGFTLIELLIVIAVLGTLAVVVLIALNPVQQLARTRDAGRASSVTQMGHAIEAYAVVNNGVYPLAAGPSPGCVSSSDWANCLVDTSEITIIPSEILDTVGPGACSTAVQNSTWCYDEDNGGSSSAIVFAAYEADSNQSKCPAAQTAYIVYSSSHGRGGGFCGGSQPTASGLGPTYTFDF